MVAWVSHTSLHLEPDSARTNLLVYDPRNRGPLLGHYVTEHVMPKSLSVTIGIDIYNDKQILNMLHTPLRLSEIICTIDTFILNVARGVTTQHIALTPFLQWSGSDVLTSLYSSHEIRRRSPSSRDSRGEALNTSSAIYSKI
jgi:hypothetical protein